MQTDLKADRPLIGALPTFRPSKVWVLLWNKSQNALHIETLDNTLRSDIDAFLENRRMDYVPLIVGDEDVIDAMADSVRETVLVRASEQFLGRLDRKLVAINGR
ncbi:hypothetical protein [Variovorax sp. ZT4R33]|uniref:hypothetical protein n=1 Tax=Variovorax sp. ZT4R33 TaxID=3443743 RepID=UPI003F44981F